MRHNDRILLAGAPIVLAMIIRLWHGGPPGFANDDVYISQHAARMLTADGDPVFREALPLTGVTSALHVFVLWLVMRVCPPSIAVEVVTWAGAAVYLYGVAVLVTARVSGLLRQFALIAIAVLGGSATTQLANGQETGWAMAAVVWGLHWMDTDAPRRARLAWLAAMTPWIRPDLGVFGLALCFRRAGTAGRFRWRDLTIVGGCWLAYVLLSWRLSGHWVPNTLEAKRLFFATYSLPIDTRVLFGVIQLANWAIQIGPLLLALMASFFRPTDRFGALGFIAVFASLTVASPDVISHNDFRYLYPLAMALAVSGVCNLRGMLRDGLVMAIVSWALFLTPMRWAEWRAAQQLYGSGQQSIADWLNRHTSPGTSVLVHDAGFLSENTVARLTDIVGLKTPSSIEWHGLYTGPSQGADRARAVHAIACRASPSYYVALSVWERAFKLTEALTQFGWAPTSVLRVDVTSPSGPLVYTLYRVSPSAQCGER